MKKFLELSRRERQIMDAIYRLGEASAAEIVGQVPGDPPPNSVRVTVAILHKKGLLRHRRDGARYIYSPTVPRESASTSALTHLLRTFFGGSPGKAVLALLDSSAARLSDEELQKIAATIEQARRSR